MSGLTPRPALWLSIALASTIPITGAIYMAPKMTLSTFRSGLTSALGLKQAGGYWRLLALLFALLNLKSLPFAWHFRLLRALLKHVSLLRSRPPSAPPSRALFTPLITRTRCSLLEMDYNLHKSNSTYFSDLDESRMHLMACIFRRGLHKTHFRTAPPLLPNEKPGRFGIYFGGVQCSFRREVRPGQQVQIWTRVLAWDRKWLYLVSHIVEDDAVRPKGYWLQPWKKGGKAKMTGEKVGVGAGEKRVPDRAILATSVSKYVFKQGRITIPPELAFQGAELLPPKPAGIPDPSPEPSGRGTPAVGDAVGDTVAPAAMAADLMQKLPSALPAVDGKEDADLGPPLECSLEEWTWEAVEKERRRGMELAKHMSALDDAVFVWSGSEGMALGEF